MPNTKQAAIAKARAQEDTGNEPDAEATLSDPRSVKEHLPIDY